MSALAMELTAKADWLDWRQGGIGASEAAAAIGVSPYETPFELYSRKVGDLPPIVENEAMEVGLLMEPVIQALYQRRTGRRIVETQVRSQSERYPFLRATLDGVTDDGIPTEWKNVGVRMMDQWGDEGSDEIPTHVLAQTHQQLIVTGAPRVDVGALLGGGEFRLYRVYPDPDLHESMIAKLAEFHARIVDRRPPEPTDKDWATIAKLRPRIEATVNLEPICCAAADYYIGLGEEAKEIEARRQEAKASLIIAMGDHSCARLPDGRQIVRKLVERKAHEVKASSFVSFNIKKGD